MVKGTKSTVFHNRIAKKYESEYNTPYWRLYKELTYQNFRKYLPKRGSLILDAGGGTGFWSREIAKLGYRVITVDIAEKMLDVGYELAKKEGLSNRIEFRKSDITKLDFDDNSFDMVLSEGDPVGYCGKPEKAIHELARVLKKGRYVVVSVDSFFSRLSRSITKKDFKRMQLLERKHMMVNRGGFLEYDFTLEELRNMFEKNGLKVVDAIGKPVLLQGISIDDANKLLSNKKLYENLLELEKKYGSNSSIVGFGGHLQIVGKKV